MENRELISNLQKEGYIHLIELPKVGICGILEFMFTWGVCYGLDEYGYMGRYCFPTYEQALLALSTWQDTSQDIQGNWIKHKGHIEYSNPKLVKDGEY